MIIGSGDIASVLPESTLLFFASGVSNSQETKESEYQREIALLSRQDRGKRLVYFSSLAVFSGEGRYINHKLAMEKLVKRFCPRHCIVRLGNIDWGTNPNTLINYLRAHPDAEIRDEWRYIVNKDEFLYWINLIPPWNAEMNIPGRRMKVAEVVRDYVDNDKKIVEEQ